MAAYNDLFGLRNNDSDLKNKISMAVAAKACAILDEATPAATRLAWAAEALIDPESKADQVMWYMFAVDKAAALSAIQTASDTTIQTRCDTAIDKLYP